MADYNTSGSTTGQDGQATGKRTLTGDIVSGTGAATSVIGSIAEYPGSKLSELGDNVIHEGVLEESKAGKAVAFTWGGVIKGTGLALQAPGWLLRQGGNLIRSAGGNFTETPPAPPPPQTNGGYMNSVPPEELAALEAKMAEKAGDPASVRIRSDKETNKEQGGISR